MRRFLWVYSLPFHDTLRLEMMTLYLYFHGYDVLHHMIS